MSRTLLDYQSRLEEMAADLPGLVHPVMQRVADIIRDEATQNLSGEVLQTRSGDLLATLRVDATQGSDGAGIEASAGDSVTPYARIHEEGGTIRPINPAGFLIFEGSRGWASVKEVVIPARPYLRPAIEVGAEELPDLLHDRFIDHLSTVG
jgi:phage gpG-like protein